MRKVFLEDLPRYTSGTYKGKADWGGSIGKSVKFVNEDIEGYINILDYNKSRQRVKVQYKNRISDMSTSSLLNSGISRLTKRRHRTAFKYSIGDIVNNNKVLKAFRVDDYRGQTCKRYEFQCLSCGYVGEKYEVDLENRKCPICSNRRFVHPDINSIKITHPNIYKHIVDNDADKYSYGSGHKVHWKCPLCKNTNFTAIKCLTSSRPTGCQFCGDGISYPEKILYNTLSFVSNTFEKHKRFAWSEGRIYDAFDKDIFIEIHGSQHYVKSFEKCGGRTLEEEIENDKRKHEIAVNNHKNLVDYVVIKAYPETFDNIKHAILNSRLTKYYNFSKVNWYDVKKKAESSLVVEVGRLYNFNDNIEDISKLFQLHNTTVYRYLHRATELGVCNFIPDYKNEHNSCKVRCKNTGEVFKSQQEAARWCGLKSSTGISNCARGLKKCKTAGSHPVTGERLEWELIN